MNPRERWKREPLKPGWFGIAHLSDDSAVRDEEGNVIRYRGKFKIFRSDRTFVELAADQGYDVRPLSQEELGEHNPRLIRAYHGLFAQMPESEEAYTAALDDLRSLRTGKEFSFKKGERTIHVEFGVNRFRVPWLKVNDDTWYAENEEALERGVPEEELDEEPMHTTILEINDESQSKLRLYCEGWSNNHEALLSAEGILLEQFSPPVEI